MKGEETIFNEALAIESDQERAAYLDQACGTDRELRDQVEKLLKLHGEAGSYLERPPEGLDVTIAAGANVDRDVDPKVMEAGIATAFEFNQAMVVGDANHSVLKSLGKKLSKVPKVILRDSEDVPPVEKPGSDQLPSSEGDGRYQLHGEIARGGMGAIIKGRDRDLGRDLAIKVLLDSQKDKPEVIERFVEEAQIGGQLQHPGIVPVYELGQFTDERPFFSMKLIKGETLAALLAKRSNPSADQARFLGIFEQVCQTMAYAHSRGVIHRDLKPANIMVGAFGEVQVMDWGLAKVLSKGGVADEAKARDQQRDVSVIRTRRSEGSDGPGDIGSETHIGSVMGTPAYMPPEQALGEIDRVDEPADVFGLGSVLCEILTGEPPYVGEDGTQVFRQACRGNLGDCLDRLDASGADQELIDIAKRAIEPEPEQRYRHAGDLSDAVSDYLNGVQERLKQAEIAKSQAQARAEEESRRRKLHLVITAMMLFMAVGAALVANHQRVLKTKANEATDRANEATLQAKEARDDAQQKSEQLAEQLQISTINRLAAESRNLRDTNPVLSTLLAMEAVEVSEQTQQAPSTALETLMNATSKLGGRAYYAHDASIRMFAASSSGMVASGDAKGGVCLWDFEANNPVETVRVLDGHRDAITSLRFTPDNRWLITTSEDGDARRWDLQSSQVAGSGQVLSGNSSGIKTSDLSRDGRWLITGSRDGTVRLWDLENDDPRLNTDALVGGDVRFILDDRWIVMRDGVQEPRLSFWDLKEVAAGNPEPTLPRFSYEGRAEIQELGHLHDVSSDGRWMLNAKGIWQLHEDRKPTQLDSLDHGADSPGRGVQFLNEDRWILVYSGYNKTNPTKIWEWHGDRVGNVVRELPFLPQSTPPFFSPDEKWMLIGTELTNLDDESRPKVSIDNGEGISAQIFTSDSSRLITAIADGGIRIWDLTDDHFTSSMINHGFGTATKFRTSPDGQWLVFAAEKAVRLAKLHNGQFTDVMDLRHAEGSNVACMEFSPDSRWFAIGSALKVGLWDLRAEDPSTAVITLTGFKGFVDAVSFTPDSASFATGTSAGSVQLWDIGSRDQQQTQNSGKLLLEFDMQRMISNDCVEISPDGRWLASGDLQSMVRLWNLQDLSQAPRTWKAHDGKLISHVTFTPDGNWLVTVGEDKTLRLWDPESENPGSDPIIRDLGAAAGWKPKVQYSPDGRSMFFRNGGGTVQRWTLTESGLSESPTVFGTPMRGEAVLPTISPDGRWLFCGVERSIQRVDLTAKDPTAESIVLRPRWKTQSMIVSADGRYFVTTNVHQMQLWPMELDELLRLARERTGRALSAEERRRYLE